MGIMARVSNDALHANPDHFNYPTHSDINITTHGSDWYWTVTGIMGLATAIFLGLSYKERRGDRIFHYITASITLVAAIAYFTMASNLGYAAIPVEFQRSNPKVAGVNREIFYVRYIDWVITTPLLLMDLLLTAGLPWPTVLYTILLDEIMIITGLVGALVSSSYKWGYFVFATVALIGIAYQVIFVGRKHAGAINTHVGKTFTMCGAWTMFLWFLYPIAWGLSEGGNVISPDSEAAFYGILDILAKPIFGALLLWGHRSIAPETLGLRFRDYTEPFAPYGAPSRQYGDASNAPANDNVVKDHHNGAHHTGTHNNAAQQGNNIELGENTNNRKTDSTLGSGTHAATSGNATSTAV